MNYDEDMYDEFGKRNDSQNDSQKSKVTLRREKMLTVLRHNSNATANELSNILEVSISTVNRDLK